jgi:branched chain amino acid efflux pump
VEWLDLIPVAILSALIVPELFTTGTPRHLFVVDAKVAVVFPNFAFAFKTRSLGGTVSGRGGSLLAGGILALRLGR